jgi:hypothetical protein
MIPLITEPLASSMVAEPRLVAITTPLISTVASFVTCFAPVSKADTKISD